MKKLIYSIIALLLSATVFAQAPQSFKYQAIARDASGDVIANQQVSFRISILQGNASGTAAYIETHADSTNQFGLVTLEIGTGTTTDDFTGIDWSNNAYFIQIEMDVTGGISYTLMGTSQLLSVPYALHAKTAGNVNFNDTSATNEVQDLSNVLSQGNDANNNNITNIADPINDQDAVTKAYVDALLDKISELEALTTTFKDYDGNLYSQIKIGNQVWMTENLKTKHYANGDAIPNGTGAGNISGETETKYWFAYNDDYNNVYTYGRLYTWYTVTDERNVCPDGWHVPSNAEWTQLTDYLGGESIAGGKLKEIGTTNWNSPNAGATNESGFTALPGGYRNGYGAFNSICNHGYWWSSTESSTKRAYNRILNFNNARIDKALNDEELGFSVRCVRDD